MVVRTNQSYTESFRTRKGVRQGYVVNPLLFNLYMEIEERMENTRKGGVNIGTTRNLVYADDIILVANNKEAMLDMMGIFKKFLKDKKLCTDKSKILVFNKRKKEKKEKWIWGGKVIEEVQDFKYLGFMISYKRDL